jgi:hypothetical protein
MMAHLNMNWKNHVNNNDKPVPVSLDQPGISRKRGAVSSADNTVATRVLGVVATKTTEVVSEDLLLMITLVKNNLVFYCCGVCYLSCHQCLCPLNHVLLSKVQVTFAISINFLSEPYLPLFGQLRAETLVSVCDTRDNKVPNSYATAHWATDYAIHLWLMLVCQQFGGGQAAAAHIGAMSSIVENAFHNTWTNIERNNRKGPN